jgi:hypothetical protein
MQTTVTGPGILTHWWMVSSESSFDYLEFYIDGVLQSGRISGEVNWQKQTNGIASGTHTLKWRYLKDGSVDRGLDAGYVDEICFVPADPTILLQPKSVTDYIGRTATFTVTASGNSGLSYQWLKDGTNLLENGSVMGVATNSLAITGFHIYDAGNYTVLVTNSSGTLTSQVAVLTVLLPQAITFTRQPVSCTNGVGQITTLTVAATGTATLSYQWLFNGMSLANAGNVSGATTPTLTIANVQTNATGLYSVVVRNEWETNTSLDAVLTVVHLPQTGVILDGLGLAWTTGGDDVWFSQTNRSHDGAGAAQSGLITHNQESWMQTAVTGPGILTHWWMVSSESSFDYLEFYIDGVLQSGKISGEVNWQKQTNAIPSGTHTLKWRYMKDGSADRGLDAGWVDEINYFPSLPSIITTNGIINNQFGFTITGSSNLVIVVEACTNLSNPDWQPVSTNTLDTFIGTNGTSYFSDPQWTNYPGRFYRLRSP